MWRGRKERKDTVFLCAPDCNALCYHEMSLSHSCFTSPSPISILHFFSLLCKSLQTSCLVILTEKFGLGWVPNFKKITLASLSYARTVNACLSPVKHSFA